MRPTERRVATAGVSGTTTKAASLGDFATERLRTLCLAAGFAEQTESVTTTFRSLLSPWGDERVGRYGDWVSEISDDNTPVEFSVAIAEQDVEVRALFEAQAEEPTMAAYREAGLALLERLEGEFGATLDRFRKVKDLFLPEGMQGPFSVWSSVVFPRHRPPQFKAYMNPQAGGVDGASARVKEGLSRLGFGDVWPAIENTVLRRGAELDELKYFALDLMPGGESRVKVYVRHHAVTAAELERAASAAETYLPGETLDFVLAMRGNTQRLDERAAFTCSSFTEGERDRPAATTVYVPVCAYTYDDAEVCNRVSKYLVRTGADPSRYEAIVRGFANRPLERGVGMQPWVALRRHRGVRLTVYLASEANRVYQPGSVPAPTRRVSAILPTAMEVGVGEGSSATAGAERKGRI